MHINVKNLKGFFAVASYGGFSAAAKKLNISQPVLTRRVQDLEITYDVQLLERSTRHVTLTQIGQVLFRRLEKVFSDLESMDILLRNEKSTELMIHSVSTPKLLEFVNASRARLPTIRLNFELMPSADVYRGLLERRCDFGFLTMHEENRDLEILDLGCFPIVAVVGETNPLFRRKTLSLHDLVDQTVIVGPLESSTRRNFDRIAQRNGVLPKSVKVADILGNCICMAHADLGVGIVGGDGTFEFNDPSARFFEETEMRQTLHLACHGREHRSRASELLFQIAKDIFSN